MIYSPEEPPKGAKLVCHQWPDAPTVTFYSSYGMRATVQISIGDVTALVTREEIACVAALFPPELPK